MPFNNQPQVENFLGGGISTYDPKDVGVQMNHSPKLGEGGTPRFVSSTPAIHKNITAIITQYPKGFDYFESPEHMHDTLKAFIERHSKTIDGLTGTITYDLTSQPVGSSGKVFEKVKGAKRDPCSPTHTAYELMGDMFTNFFLEYGNKLLAHPYSQLAGSGLKDIPDYLFDDPIFNTFSVLYFRTDNFGRKVTRAWLCGNMAHKASPEIVGKKDVSTGGEEVELSVNFTAITLYSDTTPVLLKVAQAMWDSMLPDMTPHEEEVFASVDDAPTNTFF